MQPTLSLNYNSQAGNGILGMGWNLSGLQTISRDLTYDIKWNSSDHFTLNGLRLVSRGSNKYSTATESFLDIEFINPDSSNSYWVVTRKDGTTLYFGATSDSRIEAVGHGNAARVWALNKVQDVYGNFYTIDYLEDPAGGDYYPDKIIYTQGNDLTSFYTVDFSFQNRIDHWAKYIPSKVDTDKRLERIIVKCGNEELLNYKLNYSDSLTPIDYSRLLNIQHYGSGGDTNDITEILWEEISGDLFTPVNYTSGDGSEIWNQSTGLTGDFNGDGLTDITFPFNPSSGTGLQIRTSFSNGDGTFTPKRYESGDGYEIWNQSTGLTGDFNGDGLTDIIHPFNPSSGTGLQIRTKFSMEMDLLLL